MSTMSVFRMVKFKMWKKGDSQPNLFFIVIKISPFLAGATIPGGSIFVHHSVAEMALQIPGGVVYAGSIPAAASFLHSLN